MGATGSLVFPTGRQGRVPYPRTLAGMPLFALAQRGREEELVAMDKVEVQLGVASPVRVFRWGMGLTAEHQDVLLAVFRMFAGLEAALDRTQNKQDRAYVDVRFSAKELLAILGKGYSGPNRDWLRRRLDELSRSHLTVLAADAKPDAWPLFSGCILHLRAREKPTQGVRCSVAIPIEFVLLFKHMGWGQIDLAQRRQLGSSQLARLLQVHIECLKDRKSNTFFQYTVRKWMELTGTKSLEENFAGDLRKALKRLKNARFLTDFKIAHGKVHLTLASPDAAAVNTGKEHVGPPSLEPSVRAPFVNIGGMRLRLGLEVPAIEEMLGIGPWQPPLDIQVYSESQLKAMKRLYPKAYRDHPELSSILERVQAELAARPEVTEVGHRHSRHAQLMVDSDDPPVELQGV